jgi:hypothetical protein
MRFRDRLTYGNVVATLALALALAGGGAWAAQQLKLKANSVHSKQIAPDAARGKDVKEATLGTVPDAQHANAADTASTATTAGTAAIAQTAANADLLNGKDATAFLSANEVHNSGRSVVDDTVPGDGAANSAPNLVSDPDITVGLTCWQNISATANEQARATVYAPDGAALSVSVVRSDGTSENLVSSAAQVINDLSSSGNVVRSAYFTAVHPDGDVVSGSVSAELNDTAPGSSDCTFGGTAIGP